MIKIIDTVDINEIQSTYRVLEPSIVWNEIIKGEQTSVQFLSGDNPWHSSTGSSKGHETAYCEIVPLFKDTIFEEIVQKYKLFRSRLMWLNPWSCYSMHRDASYRIHIPIFTNDQCFFVFKDNGCKMLDEGKVYLVDTTRYHTAMNGSDFRRLHFVGCV